MQIYDTRYQAQKEKRDGEKVIKVNGGYAIMTFSEYEVWKKQK